MFRQCQTGPPCPLAQPGKHQVIIVKGKFSLSQRWTVKLCDSSIRLGSAGHGLARPSDGPRVTGSSAAMYDLVLSGMGVTNINYYCDSKTITATPADPNVSSCALSVVCHNVKNYKNRIMSVCYYVSFSKVY